MCLHLCVFLLSPDNRPFAILLYPIPTPPSVISISQVFILLVTFLIHHTPWIGVYHLPSAATCESSFQVMLLSNTSPPQDANFTTGKVYWTSWYSLAPTGLRSKEGDIRWVKKSVYTQLWSLLGKFLCQVLIFLNMYSIC